MIQGGQVQRGEQGSHRQPGRGGGLVVVGEEHGGRGFGVPVLSEEGDKAKLR
jgi:hypothetical protein